MAIQAFTPKPPWILDTADVSRIDWTNKIFYFKVDTMGNPFDAPSKLHLKSHRTGQVGHFQIHLVDPHNYTYTYYFDYNITPNAAPKDWKVMIEDRLI
jgi:hypothetical protein